MAIHSKPAGASARPWVSPGCNSNARLGRGTPTTWAAKLATSTIPVVFHTDTDPVAAGLVAGLARPGGNLTGISLHELEGKRIELLVELMPHATTIAFLVNPRAVDVEGQLRNAPRAAGAKRLTADVVTAPSATSMQPLRRGTDRAPTRSSWRPIRCTAGMPMS